MKVSARASVRDALRLRAAAIDLLGGGQPDWTEQARSSHGTWDVFLRTERCALALKARIAAAGREVPDHVEMAATRELQRILSARGQLLRIGKLAGVHGIPAIVLKGGVAALASAAPVDLDDVDVLVQPLQAERVAELLDEEGFRSTGRAGPAHLPGRITPNAVPIEVHFAINDLELDDATWRRARQLDGVPGLWIFGAADHLWHLLVHTVVTHPYRRGSLRDLLLAAEALRDCSPAELEDVEHRVVTHPFASPLTEVLTMARELGEGGPVEDRFRREAAANYLLRGPLGTGSSHFWRGAFVGALFSLLGSAVDRRHEWVVASQRPPFSSPWGFAARPERRSPRVGRWSRTAVKITRLIVVRMAAWPIAVAARRVAKS